jgi:hypothetical protein
VRLYRAVPTIPRRLLVLVLLTLPTGCDQVRGLLGQDAPAEAKSEAKDEAKEEAKADAGAAKAPADAKAADAAVGAIEPDEKGEPDGKAEPPPPDAAAEVAGTDAMPCVIGRWDAVDYSAAVEHAIAKDETLRSMKRTSSGGHVAYLLADPKDGKGVITATADALTYAFSGKVQGYAVTAKVTIDGETVADYELVGDDGIRIAKPTKNTMKAKVAASVKGIASAKQNKTIDLDFDGSFVFDCTEEKLEVWRGARSKARPTSFRRAPAETP